MKTIIAVVLLAAGCCAARGQIMQHPSLAGEVVGTLGDGAYLVRPDVATAVKLRVPVEAVTSGTGTSYRAGEVLLVSDSTYKVGDPVGCLVRRNGPYRYKNESGAMVVISSFTEIAVAPEAAPKPTDMQSFFGPNTKMQGSALDGR
jgi:hypothetical protein